VSTLNEDDAVVTHFDVFGDGTPLCGFIGDGETTSGDWLGVDCRDCMVAMSSEEGTCGGCGRMIVMTGVPLAWRVSAADPDVLTMHDTALCERGADAKHEPA
jgi:hypothetical protein